MKAVFVRVNGTLKPDMLVGGLIDMGVPPLYLKACLKDAGIQAEFIEQANPKAQISAHYFHIPPQGDKPLLLKQADIFKEWRHICEKKNPDWESVGWSVFSALTGGASDAIDEIPANVIDLRRVGVREEHLLSLYLFLCALDYLSVESLFVVPFSLAPGKSEAARATKQILTDAGSTVGTPVSAELIEPFAAAMLEGLSAAFMPMDSRFLADKTAYGSASAERPTGDNTVGLYLGYFNDRGESVFSRHLKIFGVGINDGEE